MENPTIANQFDAADAERAGILDRVREQAALTLPSVLPPLDQTQASPAVLCYQNIGADGVAGLVSRMLTALFPPGTPWFKLEPAPKAHANPLLTFDQINAFIGWLYNRTLAINAKLDATNYRVKHRMALEQVLVAGNALCKLTDDYRIKAFRIDQWVLRRDPSNLVLWTITRESVDIDALSDEALAKAEIDRSQYESKTGNERNLKLYTRCQKDRNAPGWTIQQELNGHIIVESQEPVSPYFVTGYEELPGENYSRAFIELKMGDLRTVNALNKAIVEGMAAFAKLLIVVDPASGLVPSDLTKTNGAIISGKVTADGRAAGVGWLTTSKVGDFSIALETVKNIEGRLGKSMLLELAAQPTGERVTATQIMRIAQELQGALGSVYAQIAEEMQRPLLDRITYQMERDNLLVPIPDSLKDLVDTQIKTGLEGLTRQMDLDKLLTFLQATAQVPGGMERVRLNTVLDRIAQAMLVNVSDILKSDEELAQEKSAAMQQQMQALAVQQGIQSLGKIAETGAAAQQQAANAPPPPPPSAQ